ncbi:GH23439 [Drosophila grimshawi]|uniref:GH23439 n=1 Tax=Drosophila grimshawi TaxID=7222 RepID=B4K0T4_DROGR|nr:GH23439 [Drosophila grimshawi]
MRNAFYMLLFCLIWYICYNFMKLQLALDHLPLNDSFSIEAINVAMQVVQNDFDVTQLCKRKTQLEATAKVKPICISKLEEILKLVDCKLYTEVRPSTLTVARHKLLHRLPRGYLEKLPMNERVIEKQQVGSYRNSKQTLFIILTKYQ